MVKRKIMRVLGVTSDAICYSALWVVWHVFVRWCKKPEPWDGPGDGPIIW